MKLEINSDHFRVLLIGNNKPTEYRYLVQKDHTSYTAFKTQYGLRRWLRDFGLSLKLHFKDGQIAQFRIEGSAEHIMVWRDEWDQIKADNQSYRLSNGDYTLNKIVYGEIRRVYYLNPNVKDRPIEDYSYKGGE